VGGQERLRSVDAQRPFPAEVLDAIRRQPGGRVDERLAGLQLPFGLVHKAQGALPVEQLKANPAPRPARRAQQHERADIGGVLRQAGLAVQGGRGLAALIGQHADVHRRDGQRIGILARPAHGLGRHAVHPAGAAGGRPGPAPGAPAGGRRGLFQSVVLLDGERVSAARIGAA